MDILDTILKFAGKGGKSTNPGQRLFPADKRPTLDNLAETKPARKAEAQKMLEPIANILSMLVPGGLGAQLATYSPDAEAASFIPAKLLTGAKGDLARQIQEQITYTAQRGNPIYNRALYNHEAIPFFVSPSSGQLMTVNPAIDKLAGARLNLKEPTMLQDLLDAEVLQYMPELRRTVVNPAKDFEYLDMWAKGIEGKFAASEDVSKALGKPHPDLITMMTYGSRNAIKPDVLAHEIQHGIQKRYGGVSPKISGKEATSSEDALKSYLADWGEKEAFASDAAVRQFQRDGVVDLPQFASHPIINIRGTNKADPSLGSLEKLILEALEAGAKDFPYAR